jgi:hypothetical protein
MSVMAMFQQLLAVFTTACRSEPIFVMSLMVLCLSLTILIFRESALDKISGFLLALLLRLFNRLPELLDRCDLRSVQCVLGAIPPNRRRIQGIRDTP